MADKESDSRDHKWRMMLDSVLSGKLKHGTRTPVRGVPPWATLEVLTGGFASGELLAGGELQSHEKANLHRMAPVLPGGERKALNEFFLRNPEELYEMLQSGLYRINVPEEGVLSAVVLLALSGFASEAERLVVLMSPWFSRLRFYPVPADSREELTESVSVQNAGQVAESLARAKPSLRLMTQREAVEVWAPFHDRLVGLFMETVLEGWPCRLCPPLWKERALALLEEYRILRSSHRHCGRPEKAGGHFFMLRSYLERAATHPEDLSGRDVGLIHHMLNCHVRKWGAPGSLRCRSAREKQLQDVQGPPYHSVAEIVSGRLGNHPADRGIEHIELVSGAVTPGEESATGIPAGTPVPDNARRKLERCVRDTPQALVEKGVISSGETLARVLPESNSELHASGIDDDRARRLYAASYRAFRRRRSLLLLDLQRQVQFSELPWISAMEKLRTEDESAVKTAAERLKDVTALAIQHFPCSMIPNKLLQELRALAAFAGLKLPLVDELAVDIFTGRFSSKFLDSAKLSTRLMKDKLYAIYYQIDTGDVLSLSTADEFASLCASRAGVVRGGSSTALNGMVIEQQQILTTQNLAVLFDALSLQHEMADHLEEMAGRCFVWICRRQRMKTDHWRAKLIMIKNTACAWRQMVFFLSWMPAERVHAFIRWAGVHLHEQPGDFPGRFMPALAGLARAAGRPDFDLPGRVFLGWTDRVHWLLENSK